jgi:hypothetical protein
MDLYIHSPIRLHGVMLNYLSTGQLYLTFTYMTEADPASETSYNSNLHKMMDSVQHNFIIKYKVI